MNIMIWFDDPEITLEANPDDLTQENTEALAISAVNRLSIGIQSFFDQDLQYMNRAHNADQARRIDGSWQQNILKISV